MERRVARAEDLPPLELRRVRTLELEEPSSPGGTPHVAAASGVVRRAEYVYVIADDELDLAVFDASSDAPGRLVPALSGELPSDHEARSKAKPDLEALTSLPPFEGHPHGALLGLGSGSTTDRDRGFAWALAADGSLDGEPIELDLAPLYTLLRERLDALNVEGAAVMEDELWLLQRGNSEHGENVVVALSCAEVLESLGRDRPQAQGRGRSRTARHRRDRDDLRVRSGRPRGALAAAVGHDGARGRPELGREARPKPRTGSR